MANGVGREVLFGLDNFHKPKMLSLKDSIAQQLINLLLMRPGNIPSQPNLGINISKYLYSIQDGFDAEIIKQQIYSQCSQLMPYISLGEVMIFVTTYKGLDLLLVSIPIVLPNDQTNLLIGFSNTQNDINIAYQFEEMSAAV